MLNNKPCHTRATHCRSYVFFSITPYSHDTLVGQRFFHDHLTVYTTEGDVATHSYIFLLMDLMTFPEVHPYASVWCVVKMCRGA